MIQIKWLSIPNMGYKSLSEKILKMWKWDTNPRGSFSKIKNNNYRVNHYSRKKNNYDVEVVFFLLEIIFKIYLKSLKSLHLTPTSRTRRLFTSLPLSLTRRHSDRCTPIAVSDAVFLCLADPSALDMIFVISFKPDNDR